MTSPDGSKGASPLRIGGLALLAVGAIAGLIGLIGLNSGSDTSTPGATPATLTEAAPPASSDHAATPTPETPATTTPPAESAAPPVAPAPTPAPAAPSGPPAAAAPAPSAPPAGAVGSDKVRSGVGAGPAAGAEQAPRSPVRVYNNSTIGGLAAGAAEDFRKAGWTVDEVGNYPSSSGIIKTSTVYYRPDTGEQGSAERLGSEFGLRTVPRFAGLTDASPGLIVIVANDYQKPPSAPPPVKLCSCSVFGFFPPADQ